MHHVKHLQTTEKILNRVAQGGVLSTEYNKIVSFGSGSLRQQEPDVADSMRSKQSLERRACRISASRYPSYPKSTDTLILPEEWKHLCGDIDGELFLLIQNQFFHNEECHKLYCTRRISTN
jgi:hypothetical protein